MTNIHAEESHAAGESNTVVQEQPTLAESAVVDAEKKGNNGRKAPKQSKSKNETAAEGAAGGSVAPFATAQTAKKSKDKQPGKSEKDKLSSPPADPLASYPNLAAWPLSAGPAPLPAHILTARALGMGPGTKRELAVAAYLRDEASQHTLVQVAEGLRAVLGGEFNVQRNVVKGLETDGLVRLNKVTIEGVGTSFRLELTPQGQAKVDKWLAGP
jgi:hypothetical protein